MPVNAAPDLLSDFEAEMGRWAEQYRGRPRAELLRLLALAVEREQLVVVAYREEILAQRIAALPAEVRELFRQALLWIWRDEAMHTVYVRGALFKLGGIRLKLDAMVQQMAGFIAGWSSSVQQHARWSTAPLSRLLAAAFTALGFLLGKVPRPVVRRLRYGSFRDFCRFNIETERTAALCWKRIAELAAPMGGIEGVATAEDLQRVWRDEEEHERVFELFANALDDQDRVIASTEALESGLRAIGEAYLPRELRKPGPLGSGGRVVVSAGITDKRAALRELLAKLDLQVPAGARAAIKASFMLGYSKRDRSVITDPELLEELALWLRAKGCSDVAVVESPNIYDAWYRNRSVAQVAEYFGLRSNAYRIVDAGEERVPHAYARGVAQRTISRTWRDADLRVSFAKLRSHPVEQVHLSIANLEGLGARCEEFLFAERQAHREDAVMCVAAEFPPQLALIEGVELAPDGLLGVMACPHPRTPRRLYGGVDALAVDCVAARHLGTADPRQSRLLHAALHWFGEPRAQLVGCDEPVEGWRAPQDGEISALLSVLAYPVYVAGSGRGALFVPEMDEQAFPPASPPGLALRAGRRVLQSVLGLRLPR